MRHDPQTPGRPIGVSALCSAATQSSIVLRSQPARRGRNACIDVAGEFDEVSEFFLSAGAVNPVEIFVLGWSGLLIRCGGIGRIASFKCKWCYGCRNSFISELFDFKRPAAGEMPEMTRKCLDAD
jgi:hypothetical protein